MFETDRSRQVLLLEGKTYTPELIRMEKVRLEERLENMPDIVSTSCEDKCRLELFSFLTEWFSDSETMTVHTSGSTGEPKPIVVRKQQMMDSAVATCQYLGLKPGDTALLCLTLFFIAGKMMVIRALVAGLDLYPVLPDGYPMQHTDRIHRFAAMVPMQVFNSLQQPLERERLKRTGILLLGGGALQLKLEKELQQFPNPVFASYGMAETLSHIALRRVNGYDASEWYTPFPNVRVSLDDGCLVIDAPMVNDYTLCTNDLAEIAPDGRFRILGRRDNIINTGGIKVQAEQLEEFFSDFLDVPFAITSEPDDKFGEIIVLVIEGSINEALLMQTLHEENLPAHQFPKKIVSVHRLPRTESGKISRSELKELVVRM